MIHTRQGGTIDDTHGSIWVILTYDSEKQRATLEIRSMPPGQRGKRYGLAGVSGPGAESYFRKTDEYYFG